MRAWGWLLLALLGALVAPAAAAPAVDTRPDPALEARVQAVSAELRCLVCQNQSLADSHADLALDLKSQVREQLRAGRSETEVVAYMTERYGDFVRYRPPLKASTLLLWAGPALLLLLGAALLRGALARAARVPPAAEPSPQERAQAATLLGETALAANHASTEPVGSGPPAAQAPAAPTASVKTATL